MKRVASGSLRHLLGAMMILGIGRRRGTRLNRLRLGIWALLVSMSTAVVLSTPGCVSCYKPSVPLPPPDSSSEDVEDEDSDEI